MFLKASLLEQLKPLGMGLRLQAPTGDQAHPADVCLVGTPASQVWFKAQWPRKLFLIFLLLELHQRSIMTCLILPCQEDAGPWPTADSGTEDGMAAPNVATANAVGSSLPSIESIEFL